MVSHLSWKSNQTQHAKELSDGFLLHRDVVIFKVKTHVEKDNMELKQVLWLIIIQTSLLNQGYDSK